MAITAYIGTPGSGKSYEVVRSVIIPAICQGRCVVTNVYGLSYEKIIDYCTRNKLLKDDITAGEIVLVENERIIQRDFFPVKGNEDKSLCKPGDLVILDECHRFFSSDRTLSSDARIFAAEHRHYSDPETGFTCDLVLVNQALSTLPRFLKERVEQTFRMKKLGALAGFGNKYRVDVFDGTKLTEANRITYYVESYKKEIFPLYKSHDSTGAIEVKTDGRGKLFKARTLILFFLFVLMSIYLLFHYTIPMFFPESKKESVNVDSVAVNNAGNQAEQQYNQQQRESKQEEKPPVSDWCIIGQIRRGNGSYIFLKDAGGRIRMVSAYKFTGSGMMIEGELEGKRVVVWSCTPVSSGASRGLLNV